MKKALLLLAIGLFMGCNSEPENDPPMQKIDTVYWSFSGSIGSGSFFELAKDTSVASISSRSGISTAKINHYDPEKFQDSISIGHLQSTRFITSKIDNSGAFSFDNSALFAFSDGGHSIRISPRPKSNVKLVPESILIFGSR